MSGPLSGRTALVTGGSRGIGAAVVRALHRDGAVVVVGHRAGPGAEALAEELGDRVHPVSADLAAPGGPATLWSGACAAAGRIDVLVNNAGAWLPSVLGTGLDDDDAWRSGWAGNLALHLTAAADLCRAAVLDRRTRGGGSDVGAADTVIVNVTSRSAHRGDDVDHLAYGAAKGGLLALTRGIARGFAREGVLAYAVAPGWVATDLADGALDPAAVAALPLGEVTPAQDVAEVVAFLASGRSRHSTGATVDITGADYVR